MIIKWFKNKVIEWVKEDWNNSSQRTNDNGLVPVDRLTVTSSKGRRLDQHGMNFTIYSANGGYVMEYSMYDPRTDERNNALHIITSDQDLGQGIAHIITFEMLRK
jgi:hypothetical protein